MADYLIIKRACVVGNSDTVRLSTTDTVYRSSIDAIMATEVDRETRLINVFGTAGHADQGFRTPKYYSNGTAVTVPRWPVVETISQAPRVVRFKPNALDDIARLVLAKDNAAVEMPRLSDLAVWFFRSASMADVLSGQDTTYEVLEEKACRELGLSDEEVAKLFLRDAELDD